MRHLMTAIAAIIAAIGCVALVPTALIGSAYADTAHPSTAGAPRAGHAVLSAYSAQSRPDDDWWRCAPGQGGSQCDNTDPYDTGCASGKDYVSSRNGIYNGSTWQVQLYYSPSCGTVWSQLQLLSGPNNCPECVMSVVRANYDASIYNTSDVGSASGGSLSSGAWSNQLHLACGGTLKASAQLWDPYRGGGGIIARSGTWYPVC